MNPFYKKNGDIKPEMFVENSTRELWWICTECGFSFKSSIRKIKYRIINGKKTLLSK